MPDMLQKYFRLLSSKVQGAADPLGFPRHGERELNMVDVPSILGDCVDTEEKQGRDAV